MYWNMSGTAADISPPGNLIVAIIENRNTTFAARFRLFVDIGLWVDHIMLIGDSEAVMSSPFLSSNTMPCTTRC